MDQVLRRPGRFIEMGKPIRLLMAALVALMGGGAPMRFARAEVLQEPAVSPGEARSGSLMLRSGGGYVEAVRLGTDVELTVNGPVVRAKVTQAFRNTTAGWVEAVYAYPLPEDGAVDALKMVVGRRVIVGEIKPREQAKQVYEQAKAAGQVAGLVEQERPNLFTNSVANIGPGQTVLVQIEYQAPVRMEGGAYSLRVPLVAAPRYNPTAPTEQGRNPVPDRGRIERPIDDPRDGKINPVSVRVKLNAGFPLAGVESPYHRIVDRDEGRGTRSVRLADGAVPADRDFELRWRPADAATPQAGLFGETVKGAGYLLAYLTPPSAPTGAPAPRETVFVIDNSGSMAGASMEQAKASLDYPWRGCAPATGSTSSGSTTPCRCSSPTPWARARRLWPAPAPSCARWRRKAGRRWSRRSAPRCATPGGRTGGCGRWCSSPTARSATRPSCWRPWARERDARECSWWASARRPTRI